MVQKRVTLREIAEATGYTIKTVSRAMQPDAIISPATRALIRAKADELGYYPNHAATALRCKRTYTIACVLGYLVNPYFGMLYEYLTKAAKAMGYTLMLFASDEDSDTELKAVESAICYGVDGVLLLPSADPSRSLALLRRRGVPVVLICREAPGEDADCVLCDEVDAGYQAGKHLLAEGHRKLIFVRETGELFSIVKRREGFLRAAAEAGLADADIRVISGRHSNSWEDGQEVAKWIIRLNREEGFTGVAVFCDMQGRQLIGEMHHLGYDCTANLGMVGFDNLDAVTPSGLPLCSVGADYHAICTAAVDLLDRRIRRESEAPVRQLFPVTLTCRGSCRPASMWMTGMQADADMPDVLARMG